MNDDLQKALAEILNKTTQGVEAGVGFLQRELPEVVQQLLIWHGVRSAIYFVVALVLAFCSLNVAKKLWAAAKQYNTKEYYDEGKAHRFFGSGVAALIATFFAVVSFMNIAWLQILIAPKLYLIEYAASLVK